VSESFEKVSYAVEFSVSKPKLSGFLWQENFTDTACEMFLVKCEISDLVEFAEDHFFTATALRPTAWIHTHFLFYGEEKRYRYCLLSD
jgi:hypothetical protein